MTKLVILVSFCLIGIGLAMPANNDQLDKPRRQAREYVKTTEIRKSIFNQNTNRLTYEHTTTEVSATLNDYAINTVSEEKKPDLLPQLQPQLVHQSAQVPPSTVEISGITTGANPAPTNPVAPQDNGGFRPHRAGSMFARIIDDIFQIPITVLQNVARLITNPFSRKTDPSQVS